jgi:non-specific serine/threonine protein kinase
VAFLQEAISLLRELGNFTMMAYALRGQSYAVEDLGDSVRALALSEEGLRISRDVGDKQGMAESLKNLARLALFAGDADRAIEPLRSALALLLPVGNRWLTSICLEILAGVKMVQGTATPSIDAAGPDRTGGPAEHLLDAVRLYAWADLLRAEIGLDPPLEMRGTPERNVALLRERLGESAFSGAWAEGRAMVFEEVVEYALAITAPTDPEMPDTAPDAADLAGVPHTVHLTSREREVAELIVQGRTNREIAEALVLSERTVDSHVRNIMGKLEINSRAQLAAWAVRHGLADAQ